MNELVVNADDLGLSPEINKGIFKGLDQGVISDASLLIDAPHAADACRQLMSSGVKAVGIHINLDQELGWDLPARERYPRPELMAMLEDASFLSLCAQSARSQIEKFLYTGLIPSHLDTHHHVHGFLPVFSLLACLALEYGIPAVRFSPAGYTLTTRKPVPYDAGVYGRMKAILVEEGIFACREMIEGVGSLSLVETFPAELVAHPSLGGDEWRVHEMEILLSDEFRRSIEERGLKIVSFSELVWPGQPA